jgi:hypothetical protein
MYTNEKKTSYCIVDKNNIIVKYMQIFKTKYLRQNYNNLFET